MASCLIHLISSGDTGRFVDNQNNDYITRLDSDLFVPVGSRLACIEASYQCNHEQDEREAKMDVIDWLVEHPPKAGVKRRRKVGVKRQRRRKPILSDDPNSPPTPIPIPVSTSKWGSKKTFTLGRKIDLPNAETLCASLNYNIGKIIPRLKRVKIFTFDRSQNAIFVTFPKKPFHFTLILHSRLLTLVGMEPESHSVDFTILGATKPANFFLYSYKDDIKGEMVTEKRYFIESLKEKLKSVESVHSYFLLPPKLSSQHDLYLYTDIVEDSLISNSRAPLLRIIPLIPTTRRVTQNFGSSLQFVKLRSTRIREIRIWMTDMWGIPIKFTSYSRLTLVVEPPPRSS